VGTYSNLSDRRLLNPSRCQGLCRDGTGLQQNEWLQVVGQTAFGVFAGLPTPFFLKTILIRPLPENVEEDINLYTDPGFRVCALK